MPGTACLQLLLLLVFRLLKEVLEILILLSILNDTAAAGLVVALRQLLVFSYIEPCCAARAVSFCKACVLCIALR